MRTAHETELDEQTGDRADQVPSAIPVGARDIAMRLGVERTTVHQWVQRKLLPPPRWVVSGLPCWDWQADVLPWVVRSGRAHMLR